MSDLTNQYLDRQYVSQFANDVLGLIIHSAGVPTDADDSVLVSFIRENDSFLIFTRPATRTAVGTYSVQLSGRETATPGPYTVRWVYTVNGIDDVFQTYVLVGEAAPAYDVLTPDFKAIVDSVWTRFADLFDSPYGGPNLMTYFQSNFGRGRIAQILRIAIGRLNTTAQPFMSYSIDDGGKSFPVAQWGSLLESALYVECIRHLIRTYVEQPQFSGADVTRLDRRDYLERWQSVLQDEEDILKTQLQHFKIASMNLGSPAVLVSGGVYGRYGPTRLAGSIAARPRYFSRFY